MSQSLSLLKHKFRDDCKHCTLQEMHTFFKEQGKDYWPHSMTKLRSMKKDQLNGYVQHAVHQLNINQVASTSLDLKPTITKPQLKKNMTVAQTVAPAPIHTSQIKVKPKVEKKDEFDPYQLYIDSLHVTFQK